MGMSTGGGPRRGLSEINVTPLVDVMLVLLVVFMVTTPVIVDEMKQRKVEVNVPNVAAEPLNADDDGVAILIVERSRAISIKFSESQEKSLILAPCIDGPDYQDCLKPLSEKLSLNKNLTEAQHVLIQADRDLPYGFVADVMNRIKTAGITRLGMVTLPPGAAAGGPGADAPGGGATEGGEQ
ncbi:MAG: biopolymer transporter ExbD [Bradymonadia bacterium]